MSKLLLVTFMICFGMSNAYAQKRKTDIKHEKRQKIDLGALLIDGELVSPGDFSIQDAVLRKKYDTYPPRRKTQKSDSKRRDTQRQDTVSQCSSTNYDTVFQDTEVHNPVVAHDVVLHGDSNAWCFCSTEIERAYTSDPDQLEHAR